MANIETFYLGANDLGPDDEAEAEGWYWKEPNGPASGPFESEEDALSFGNAFKKLEPPTN